MMLQKDSDFQIFWAPVVHITNALSAGARTDGDARSGGQFGSRIWRGTVSWQARTMEQEEGAPTDAGSENAVQRSRQYGRSKAQDDFNEWISNLVTEARKAGTKTELQKFLLGRRVHFPPSPDKRNCQEPKDFFLREVRFWDPLIYYDETIVPGYKCPKCKNLVSRYQNDGWAFRPVLSENDYYIIACGKYRCTACAKKFNTSDPDVKSAMDSSVQCELQVHFGKKLAFDTNFLSGVYSSLNFLGPGRVANLLNQKYVEKYTNRMLEFTALQERDSAAQMRQKEIQNGDIKSMMKGIEKRNKTFEATLNLEELIRMTRKEQGVDKLKATLLPLNKKVFDHFGNKKLEAMQECAKNVLELATLPDFWNLPEAGEKLEKPFGLSGDALKALATKAAEIKGSKEAQMGKIRNQVRVIASLMKFVKAAQTKILQQLNRNKINEDRFEDMQDVQVVLASLELKTKENLARKARNQKKRKEAEQEAGCEEQDDTCHKKSPPKLQDEFGVYDDKEKYDGFLWSEQTLADLRSKIFELRKPQLKQIQLAQPCKILSVDATYKVPRSIVAKVGRENLKPFETLITCMNEKGALVLMRLCENREKHADLRNVFETIQDWQRERDSNWRLELLYTDNCCSVRNTAKEVFGEEVQVRLDPFHFMDRFKSWMIEPTGPVASAAQKELSEAMFLDSDKVLAYQSAQKNNGTKFEIGEARKMLRKKGELPRVIPPPAELCARILKWAMKYTLLGFKSEQADQYNDIAEKLRNRVAALEELAGPSLAFLQSLSVVSDVNQYQKLFRDTLPGINGKVKKFDDFLLTQLNHAHSGCLSDHITENLYVLRTDGSALNARGTSRNERVHRDMNELIVRNNSFNGIKTAEVLLTEMLHRWNRKNHFRLYGCHKAEAYVDFQQALAINSLYRTKYKITTVKDLPFPAFSSCPLNAEPLGIGLFAPPEVVRDFEDLENKPEDVVMKKIMQGEALRKELFDLPAKGLDKKQFVQGSLVQKVNGDGWCGDRSFLASTLRQLQRSHANASVRASPFDRNQYVDRITVKECLKRVLLWADRSEDEVCSFFCVSPRCKLCSKQQRLRRGEGDDPPETSHLYHGDLINSKPMFEAMLRLRQLAVNLILEAEEEVKVHGVSRTLTEADKTRALLAVQDPTIKGFVQEQWLLITAATEKTTPREILQDFASNSLFGKAPIGVEHFAEAYFFPLLSFVFLLYADVRIRFSVLMEIETPDSDASSDYKFNCHMEGPTESVLKAWDSWQALSLQNPQISNGDRFTPVHIFILYNGTNHFDVLRDDPRKDHYLGSIVPVPRDGHGSEVAGNGRDPLQDCDLFFDLTTTLSMNSYATPSGVNESIVVTVRSDDPMEPLEVGGRSPVGTERRALQTGNSSRAEEEGTRKDGKDDDGSSDPSPARAVANRLRAEISNRKSTNCRRQTDLDVLLNATTGTIKSLATVNFSKDYYNPNRQLEFALFYKAMRSRNGHAKKVFELFNQTIYSITRKARTTVLIGKHRAARVYFKGAYQLLFCKSEQQIRDMIQRSKRYKTPRKLNSMAFIKSTESNKPLTEFPPVEPRAPERPAENPVNEYDADIPLPHLYRFFGTADKIFGQNREVSQVTNAAPFTLLNPGGERLEPSRHLLDMRRVCCKCLREKAECRKRQECFARTFQDLSRAEFHCLPKKVGNVFSTTSVGLVEPFQSGIKRKQEELLGDSATGKIKHRKKQENAVGSPSSIFRRYSIIKKAILDKYSDINSMLNDPKLDPELRTRVPPAINVAEGCEALDRILRENNAQFRSCCWLEEPANNLDLQLLSCFIDKFMRIVYRQQSGPSHRMCLNNDELPSTGEFWAGRYKPCIKNICRILHIKNLTNPDYGARPPSYKIASYLGDWDIDNSLRLLRTKLWTSDAPRQLPWTFMDPVALGFAFREIGNSRSQYGPTNSAVSQKRRLKSSAGSFSKDSWLVDESFLDKEMVFLPICESNHWELVVMYPKIRQMAYYNSLDVSSDSRRAAQVIQIAHQLFAAKVTDPSYTLACELHGRPTPSEGFLDFASWRVVHVKPILQRNLSDCGVILLLHVSFLIRGEVPKPAWERHIERINQQSAIGKSNDNCKERNAKELNAASLARERIAVNLLIASSVCADVNVSFRLNDLPQHLRPNFTT